MAPIVLWDEETGFGDGDPAISLAGSGEAVPRGVEAAFRYNGLTLNDKSVIDKYRVTSIDGLDDPDIRDNREPNPSAHGETAYGAFYSGRTLGFNGRIEAYQLHKLRDMQMALKSAFVDLTEKPLYFLTGNPNTDHFINCRKFSKIQWSETQKDENFFREFAITLRASDPRFMLHKRKTYHIENLTEDHTEYMIINNKGNFEAFPTIRMGGPLNRFQITNEATGEVFALKNTVTIPDGGFYELEMTTNGVTIQNQANVNKFGDFSTSHSTDMKIMPGNNTFSVHVDAAGNASADSYVDIKFRDSYL